ncbi:heme biosynthesis protein HemY [Methylocapsa palsarum]|uniref:HemY protein n=1 Tax=Methylocapsa palsarum TaxID=1612308 RepID=A0A1I3WGR6_9HYPH|nr:heme biosynthesis HemY N-terminal domain-containing protein [Methylocapsa palsarum]SFK05631.1 HemY protein [Methylocapsa palsarum]
MLRVLLFFAFLIAVAFADAWFADKPGEILVNWQGYHIKTSLAVGVGVVLSVAFLLVAAWALIRFVFKIPAGVSLSSQMRRRNKGFAALSRGLIAVNAGDAAVARASAVEAQKHLRHEPLALLLKAQAAQLANNQTEAEDAFKAMTHRSDMKLIGLRGLHAEAHRRGDVEDAHEFAAAAHDIARLPWTSQALMQRQTAKGDWRSALRALDNDAASKKTNRTTQERQRAVLETAIALEKSETSPDEALNLVRSALKREPNFVPALALAARLMNRKGETRKASKLIETAWPAAPHPDLANAYLEPRSGDSPADLLVKAQTLARLAPRDPESLMMIARTAIAAGNFKAARDAMQPLIEGPSKPTIRMCHIMADLEEAEHGSAGYVREWLARGARAPHDPVWVADGLASDHWLPASPVTGKLDAFVWQRPIERLRPDSGTEDAVFAPLASPEPRLQLEEAKGKVAGATQGEPPAPPSQSASTSPAGSEPGAADRTIPHPVIFPLPGAPDDPGLDERSASRGAPPAL